MRARQYPRALTHDPCRLARDAVGATAKPDRDARSAAAGPAPPTSPLDALTTPRETLPART